jgi:putative addiction module killer protein
LERVKLGNYGDYKTVGDGVFELRFLELGLRVYFAEIGSMVVLILNGGGKNIAKDQTRNIERAKFYWKEFKKVLDKGDDEK